MTDLPNVHRGALLVAEWGSADEALRRIPPHLMAWHDVKAWLYVTTGVRPVGWVPPVVRT